MTGTRVAVVVPVKDGGPLLAACLDSLLPQLDGARLVVVDDGSTDGGPALAQARGATVLHSTGGPYAARNLAWRTSGADVLAFTDVRCRALPGWLDGLVTTASRPGTAVAGTDVAIDASAGDAASRWALRDEPFSVARNRSRSWLPYVPTASMGVRRDVLEALDGFRVVRSGGDADLCWRAQLAGLGEVVAVPGGPLMTHVPRAGVRPLLRQVRRYGLGYVALTERFREDGCPPATAQTPLTTARQTVREVSRATVGAVLGRRDDVAVDYLDAVRHVVHQRALREAVRRRDAA